MEPRPTDTTPSPDVPSPAGTAVGVPGPAAPTGPTAPIAGTSAPQGLADKIRRSAVAWLFWRLPMLAFWWWITAAIVNKMASQELVPATNWLLVGPVITALYVLAAKQGLERPVFFVWFFVYLLFFPLIMAILVIWNARKVFRPARQTLQIALYPTTNLWTAAFAVPLLLVCWLALLLVEQPNVLVTLIVVDVVLNTLLLAVCLRWASDPLYPFTGLASFVIWLHRKYDEAEQKGPPKFDSDEQKRKNAESWLKILGHYETWMTWGINKVEILTRRTIVPLFSVLLISMFSVTVLGYGIAACAAQRLPEHAFSGLDADLFKTCVFSVSLITTAPLGYVSPSTWLGHLLYGTELISTFLIASVFFAMFSAAMGVHGNTRIGELKALCQEGKAWIDGRRSGYEMYLNVIRMPSPTDPSQGQAAGAAQAPPPSSVDQQTTNAASPSAVVPQELEERQ